MGEFEGDANGEAIGVGGSESKLPKGKTEAALEIFADPEGVIGGEHESDAFFGAAGVGFDDDLGGVAGHGAGVAGAKVEGFAAVDGNEMRGFGRVEEGKERARPVFPPCPGR